MKDNNLFFGLMFWIFVFTVWSLTLYYLYAFSEFTDFFLWFRYVSIWLKILILILSIFFCNYFLEKMFKLLNGLRKIRYGRKKDEIN